MTAAAQLGIGARPKCRWRLAGIPTSGLRRCCRSLAVAAASSLNQATVPGHAAAGMKGVFTVR